MQLCYTIQFGSYLAIADLDSGFDGTFYISRINVPVKYRGKGFGSKLLDKICEDADQDRVILELGPSPSGGLNMLNLVGWYASRGFRWAEHHSSWHPEATLKMVRYPNWATGW